VQKLALALVLCLACSVAFAATSQHVVVVALENHSYSAVVGSPAMPYLNSLISQGALATNAFANVHNSIGDYFMVSTGAIVSTNPGFAGTYSGNNLARLLNAKGLTWKVYAQSLPSVGYLGSTSGAYVKWHNPFAYFTDVVNSAAQKARLVPIGQLGADTAANTLPNFSFIVPDNNHNGHNCPTAAACTDFDVKHSADLFLQDHLPALINTAQFQKDGVLIIWWDEGVTGDNANGGGHVELNFFGPHVKRGYRTADFALHQHVLRTITDVMGLAAPNGAATVAGLNDVFTTATNPPPPPPPPTGTCAAPATTPATHICSPAAGAGVTSPVTISATSRWDGKIITHMTAYVDGVAKCQSTTKNMACSTTAGVGTHSLIINTWNSTGAVMQAKSTFSVH
jgi:phosphatidylinositol-3-phosphatase